MAIKIQGTTVIHDDLSIITNGSTIEGRNIATDGTKLDTIETSATADQTGTEIKALYELETKAFTDALFDKLALIDVSADDDQTGAEIKALYELETKAFTDNLFDKLSGIESGATGDLTGAEIKALYELEGDAFTDAQFVKLAAIEENATGDLTGSEIKALYEAEGNAFTDSLFTKLAAIEANAKDDQTAAEIKALYEAETKAFTDTLFDKLTAIEAGATADQTPAQIKAAYEGELYAFTDAQFTKLAGIESGATADQTGAQIKVAYEAEANTNAFTDAEKTKLGTVESNADVTDATNVQAAGALMDSELTDGTAVKAINQNLATTDSPTFVEVNATTFDVETNVEVGEYIDLQTTVATKPAHAEGRIFYDEAFGALAVYNDEADITLQVGQEEYIRVYNNTGSTIANGIPVYLTGEAGSTPTIAVARADGTYEQSQAVGIATHDIENNSTGYVTVRGLIADTDTSSLTVGQKVHVAVGASGGVQTASPTYPNFPTAVGICLISGVNGCIYVYVQTEALETLRVTGNSHFDANVTIDGDLTVLGNQTIASSSNVSIANAWNYFNSGDTIGALNTAFTGTGLDDMSLTGHFTGTSTTNYYVRIDSVGGGTGGVDTFEWSTDNFATFIAQDVDITGSDQLIHSTDNIAVNFNATTGHTLGDVWTGTGSPINVDTGFASNRNTGTSGIGYTHLGIFYDVSTNKWTVFDEYEPEPEGIIDTTDASFSLGTILAGNFEGSVTGNVTGALTGNAATASALETGRTITLSGDVTGSVSFNGTTDVNITTTVGDDSHDHTNATTSADGFMSSADKTKIDGIEASATADQTAAEIKAAYESNSDTNEFSDAEQTKLAGIEAGATNTVNPTDAEIRTAVEAATDSNVFTDADHSKLNGIETGANVTDTANVVASLTAGSGITIAGDGTISGANQYSHPTYSGDDLTIDTGTLSGATVISDLDFNVTTDTLGHVTDANATIGTRTLTLANLGYTGETNANNYIFPYTVSSASSGLSVAQRDSGGDISARMFRSEYDTTNGSIGYMMTQVDTGSDNYIRPSTASQVRNFLNVSDGATNYTHPTFDGDDFSVDTGPLTGATVVSDIDINVTTDANGHVTDANGSVATRTLTLADLGYTGETNANNSTPNATHTGEVTGSDVLTIADNVVDAGNLAVSGYGNTSQYLRSDGDGSFSWVTPPNTDTNTTYTAGTGMSLNGTTFNCTVVNTDTNTTYTADGNYGLTLSGTTFQLEDDRRRNSSTTDIWSGNTHDYTFYDASVGIRWYTAGAEDMRLEDGGDLHVDGDVVAYSATVSDIRLKEDIQLIENALDKVSQLNGYTFTYKLDGKKSAGVIAQEVEEVLPSAVSEKGSVFHKDAGDTHKVVQYDQLHGLLIEAIKELKSEIEELKKG